MEEKDENMKLSKQFPRLLQEVIKFEDIGEVCYGVLISLWLTCTFSCQQLSLLRKE